MTNVLLGTLAALGAELLTKTCTKILVKIGRVGPKM